MILLPFFTQLVLLISSGMELAQTVANAHMLFNGLGVLVMLPFLGFYERVLTSLIPDQKRKTRENPDAVSLQ